MRIKRNIQSGYEIEQERNDIDAGRKESEGQISTREARYRIYSCVFCEFVRDNLSGADEDLTLGSMKDPIFEAKYLHHLKAFHSLERWKD